MTSKPEYIKGEVCGVGNCRSKIYYWDSGLLYCKKGHLKEGHRDTQLDEDGFGTQGHKIRRKREIQEKVTRIYHGSKALELFLQSYQLILWEQCYAFVHDMGLPAELEIVVKDLWALRLQLLKDKVTVESDGDTIFSSQTQTEDEAVTKDSTAGREWKVNAKAMPTLVETLGLCYLGIILLRLPISLGEMHRWATQEDIPFIRALRLVPKVMKDKLPPHYIGALDTQTALELNDLHKAVHQLVLLYNHHFGLVLPPLNYPSILFKHIKDLALPIELYTTVRRTSSLLAIDFSFPKPGSRQTTSSLPEIQLISLLVIAVKLYHPFDLIPRYPKALTDIGTLTIDWTIWCSSQTKYDTRHTSAGKIGRGNEINVNEDDIMKMSGDQLDEYMDWYEKTWVKPENEQQQPKSKGTPQQILDMFPTGRSSPLPEINSVEEAKADQIALNQRLELVQNSLKLRDVISPENAEKSETQVRRIGDLYKRYKTAEALPPHARIFHEAAATAAGISLKVLVRAVLQIERKLRLFRERQLRTRLGDIEDDDGFITERSAWESDNPSSGSENSAEEGDDRGRLSSVGEDVTSDEEAPVSSSSSVADEEA